MNTLLLVLAAWSVLSVGTAALVAALLSGARLIEQRHAPAVAIPAPRHAQTRVPRSA